MKDKKLNLKCISLIGDLDYLGKHVYFPDMGVTLCGCFTVHYDKTKFLNMPENIPSEYKTEEWDITCERCLEMTDMFERIKKGKQERQN